MTAIQRKEHSEKILGDLGIVLKDDLPPLEEEGRVTFRSASDVAQRILILTYLNCVANDPSLQQEVMIFLIREKLWEKASEEERELFHKTPLSEDDLTTILWRAESIWTLLWIIGKVDTLDLPDNEVDLTEIFLRLPGFFEPTANFVSSAGMRSESEILDQLDLIFRINWWIRENPASKLNAHVAYERYVAMSWVTGAPWEK